MSAPDAVIALVERLHQHIAAYKQSQGYAAAYKEAIHEDAVTVVLVERSLAPHRQRQAALTLQEQTVGR